MPQVLGSFLIGPKLDAASETLKCLGTLPELATENIFQFLLYLWQKIMKKKVKQVKMRGF